MNLLHQGAVDLGILGDQPTIQARSNNIDLKVISTFCTAERGYGFIATQASGIHNLKDIKGKKIGVPIGTTGHQLLLLMLESVGIKENEVKIVNLSQADASAALKSNSIDGAVLSEPTVTAVKKFGCKEIIDGSSFKQIVCVVAGRNEFLKENPKIAARILKVLDKAAKWSNENEKAAVELVSKATNTPKRI